MFAGTRFKSGIALAASGIALMGCEPRQDRGHDNLANQAQKQEPQPSALPQPEPVLNRQALLEVIAKAAGAFAAGENDGAAQKELAGRQFSFRIAFGCSGPSEDVAQGSLVWTYDREGRVLRVRASPDISQELAWVEAIAGAQVEAVQGFWVERPWLLEPRCRPETAASTPDQRQLEVGLAQFFTSEDSRVQLRSRPFEAVHKVEEKSLPGTQGLHLVLSGRLKELPDGRVIACMAPHPSRRPVCIASVEFDRVLVEDPATQSALGEWGVG